jgi:biopolymer transport protein ExbD
MKKTAVALMVLICAFIMVSCPYFTPDEVEMAHAAITVYNQSDFDVADLSVGGNTLGLLKSGDEQNLNIDFPVPDTRLSVEYRINDNSFDVEKDEDALYYNVLEFKKIREADGITKIEIVTNDQASLEKDIYYSPWRIRDGAKIEVYIKNEGYKLEVIDGGAYSVITPEDIFPPVPRE